MILFLAFHLTGDVFSQEVQVSGRIQAKRDGTGLSGAVVYCGADSASTDSLGYYKLVLPQKATSLEVSAWHPDFPPHSAFLSAASGSQTLDMVLGASVQLLDQVVVTGNGYQQSRSTTGNATTLLNRSPEGTAASARLSEGLRGVPGA